MNDTIQHEKIGLLIIVGMIVVALTWIAIDAMDSGINSEAATLVGVVVTGLAAFGKDIVAALRGYSMAAQLGKVTDQLAASQPPPSDPPPADAAEAAQDTADAAQVKADAIKGQGA